MAPRCAIVPPVPVPYREPLFELLARRRRIEPRVIYLAGGQPGWDQPGEWFPARHRYDSITLRSRQRARPGRSPITFPRGLGRALADFGGDCVVSWEFGPATLRALAWSRRARRPLVVFSEVTAAGERELPPAQRALQRCLASRVAGFVAASTAARRRLEALGVPPDRIEVSLQSADVEAFRAVSREFRVGGQQAGRIEGAVRVLAVGRLVPDKNLELLIAAFADAGLPGAAELELCGSGPLEGRLRALASRRGVPVRFRGYVPPEELPRVYAKADLLALVSAYEPFGAAVREAVAAGLPLLCARTAGAAGELALEDENALLVDPGDRAEVSAALARLVRDGALRSRMAAASRAISARHPLEADAEAFERSVLGALSSYLAGPAAPPGEASP